MVLIPYIYIVFVRGYFIRKYFMLDEVLLCINFKCIVDDNLGKIIKKVYINQRILYLDNIDNLITQRYYVSSKYKPRMVIRNLKYYGITNPLTDFEISDYELWKQLKIS